MPANILTIGIDSPNHELLSEWMRAGFLPHLEELRQTGQHARLNTTKSFRNSNSWEPIYTGQAASSLSYWGAEFRASDYYFHNQSLFQREDLRPFYAYAPSKRSCIFDLPVPLLPGLNGCQVVGWGTEENSSFPGSIPADLLGQLNLHFGYDPKLKVSHAIEGEQGKQGRSYVIPTCYQAEAMHRFHHCLLTSVEKRLAICDHLLEQEDWDLFVAFFPETHSAGHNLWHLSQPHPLRPFFHEQGQDPLLETYQAVDAAIGHLVQQHADEAGHVVVFTVDSTKTCSQDLPSMLFLPEFLYRWSFPGQVGLRPREQHSSIEHAQPLPVMRVDYAEHWKYEVWKLYTDEVKQQLQSPQIQERQGDPLSWMPANWYRPLWPRMKAFALPGIADGYVRLNVRGRETEGVVDDQAFGSVCDEICSHLNAWIEPRSGQPLVSDIQRVRTSPHERTNEHPADLIVCWNENLAADVVDCQQVGRIGPAPYFRTGGHAAHGRTVENWMLGKGPRFDAASQVAGKLEDLPATILDLLGSQTPEHFSGSSLLGSNTPDVTGRDSR